MSGRWLTCSVGVLRLCDEAGLVGPGVVSIDGTRIDGNCSPDAKCQYEQIAQEILAQTKATDEAEDGLHGEDCGNELPEQLRTPDGRREFFRQGPRHDPHRIELERHLL
jgi:hypothetical protein